jgi:hypothetical protein
MTTLQIIITLLALSVGVNIVALWFIRNLLTKLFFVSNNMGEVNDVMLRFAEHLDAVHAMETFYGDQTLQGLLQHSELVVEMLGEFDEIYRVAEGYDNLGVEAEQEGGEAIDTEEA